MKKDYRKYSETSNNEEVQLTIDDIQEVVGVNEIPEDEEVVEEVTIELSEEVTEEIVEETQNDSEEHTGETEMETNEDITFKLTEEGEELVSHIEVGVLNGCAKLNVRKEASKDSEVVCVIDKDTEFTVDIVRSTEDFYKVYTCVNDVLIEGFCVKQFVSIK